MECKKNISCFCMKYKPGRGKGLGIQNCIRLNQLTWSKITENSPPPSLRNQKFLSPPPPMCNFFLDPHMYMDAICDLSIKFKNQMLKFSRSAVSLSQRTLNIAINCSNIFCVDLLQLNPTNCIDCHHTMYKVLIN